MTKEDWYDVPSEEMTLEQARQAVKDLRKELAEYLEQEPTTKNDLGVDCIVDVLGSYTDLDIPYKREIAENILTKLPSVTPQPRKGHWIDNMDLGYHVSICSNCNWRGHGDTCLIYKPKYCPNCGCAMVEPQESEDKE